MTDFKCLKAVSIFNFLEVNNGGMCSQQFMMLLKRCLHESQRKTFMLWLSFVNPGKDRSSRKRKSSTCFPAKFRKFLRTHFFIGHLRWLLLEEVSEGTSLVKILQLCHFNIFGINRRCFRKMPIKNNNE